MDYSQSITLEGETDFLGYETDQAEGAVEPVLVDGADQVTGVINLASWWIARLFTEAATVGNWTFDGG